MVFYFCSEQCRETFSKHPQLYSTGFKAGRPERVKHRKLVLAQALRSEHSDLIQGRLQQMMGVKEVSIKERTIRIAYDLMQVSEKQIEAALSEEGARLANRWINKLRRHWIQEAEENELRNLASGERACCNRPPPRV